MSALEKNVCVCYEHAPSCSSTSPDVSPVQIAQASLGSRLLSDTIRQICVGCWAARFMDNVDINNYKS